MDLSQIKMTEKCGTNVPSVVDGENFDRGVALGRVPSFDIANLLMEIKALEKENKTLRCSLARKYSHCDKLRTEIEMYKAIVIDLDNDVLDSQSGIATTNSEPGLSVSESAPMVKEQITAFADQDAGWTTSVHGEYDVTRDAVEAGDSHLGDFLSRPIRQSVQSWVVNQPFFYQFNPWKEFIENPFVADKIKNYELLRMKLHCKMVISGTKFHYGRALASYNPLSGLDQVTVERNFISLDLIQASQKPHFFLNPTKNTGGELCMPFFWNQNYLSLSDQQYNDMGEITVKSFSNLRHANGGDDPVTITIYLWAEDVVLTMPTQYQVPLSAPLKSQAGKRSLSQKNKKNSITTNDEYGTGIISKPAALVAKAAGVLSEMPIIRPYALATQMVAEKVGEVAKIFGYSRPSVVSDIQLYKPNPTGNLANVDAADAVHKLTLDSKAELTIDTRVAGLDGVDQMGILDIAQRESYLTTFAWSPTMSADDLLFNARVTPMLFDFLSVGGEIHPTPMSMLAQCFDTWNGSIKFRFQIVKSDFHKGRILARFDPNFHSGNVEYNTNYSRVIDIAEEDDFEIVVGWAQSEKWLKCGTLANTSRNFSDIGRLNYVTSEHNGILELNVLNELVSPGEDSTISVNVFVSMCEDAKFAAPNNSKLNNLHLFALPPLVAQALSAEEEKPVGPESEIEKTAEVLESQSGMLDGTENPTNPMSDRPTGTSPVQPIGSEGEQADQTYTVWYGDPPTSIRELCKRYVMTRYWITPLPAVGTRNISILTNKDASYQTGYDPEGIDFSQIDGTTPLSVVNKDFASWWSPCYAGVRGARRKKYLFGNVSDGTASVVRGNFVGANNGKIQTSTIAYNLPNEFLSKLSTRQLNTSSGAGASTTNCSINNTIEVELPFYATDRFRSARNVRAQSLPSNSHTVTTQNKLLDSSYSTIPSTHAEFQQWDAVGEDFTLMFFTGAPILYNYEITGYS